MKKTILNSMLRMSLGLGLFLGASGCGSASGTVDPITLFSDSSLPKLDSITTSSYSGTSPSIGFTASTPYWVFTNGSFFGSNYVAPAKGIVSATGTTVWNNATTTFVTIVHSGRLATRVYGMDIVQVRPGDAVISGQVIGSFVRLGIGNVGFQVLLDGSPVCPLSFMSDAFRSALLGYFTLPPCL